MITKSTSILLLYTGGTIGMIRKPETQSLENFDFESVLDFIPELKLLDCHIHTKSFDMPLDSSNMTPKHWICIAAIIEEAYSAFDGFVVLHGSDTMSYTASALSFMLENLSKPVVLTGSQLPIGDLRTDAKENVITAIQLAALQKNNQPIVKEVCLYFEYKLYRGNRTTKINADFFEAFTSPNYPALVESGVQIDVNFDALLKSYAAAPLIVHKNLDTNVALVKLFPGINPKVLEAIFNAENLKGVVLETYGSGNATSQAWFLNLLKKTIDRGVHIVNVTQCARGSVRMGNYETSSDLIEIGLISGGDITSEAALTKLMYMIGASINVTTFKTVFETAIRGELS